MASKRLLVLVILSLVNFSLQDVTDNKVDSKDESPLADVAKEILKEKDLENIGGIVNSFIQSGGAKQIMDGVLQNLASGENSGQLLETLGSLLSSGGEEKHESQQDTKKTATGEVNPMELLSGIGSLVGALQGAGGGAGGDANPAALLQGLGSLLAGGNNQGEGNNAAALLQGLGSLLGSATQEKGRKESSDDTGANLLQGLGSVIGAALANQGGGGDNNAGALLQGLGSLLGGGQGGQGGINPEMIGNMINMFANSGTEEKKEKKPSKATSKKVSSGKLQPKKSQKAKKGKDSSEGLKGVLSLAKTFLKNKGKDKEGKNSENSENIDLNIIFENLPFILKMARSFGGPNTKKYLDPLDDIIALYNDALDERKQFNLTESAGRLFRIYQAYRKLIAPHLKLNEKSKEGDDSFDLQGILDMAGSFLNLNQGDGGEASSFMDYLPMILNTINAFTGKEAQERADSHSEHSSILPPVLEKIHVYYDNFLNSDMGKYLLNFIENQPTFKIFQDEKGNFSYDKFETLIENHSFRKHWIQQLVGELIKFLQVISDERVYNQYVDMGIMFTNSYLKRSGFPKKTFIDPKKPAKSFINFANYAVKKYLGTEVDAKEYIEPAVFYIQDILRMAHKSISPGAQPKELADKLTDTINMEIIEPITRVNRAYRFTKSQPECDKYVLCLVNQEATSYSESLPNFKKALYKGSSLIAGWFISTNTGTPYMDIYTIVKENKNCNAFYHDTCSGFHEEEIKATTEYVHSEL